MKIQKTLFTFLLMLIIINGQEVGKWRYNEDFRVGSDHMITEISLHFAGNWYIADKLEDANVEWWEADLITFSMGCLWEVKDAYLPREKYPIIGGYGFCPYDIAANAGAIVVNRLVKAGLKRVNIKLFKNK